MHLLKSILDISTLIRGDKLDIENLTALCAVCHNKKSRAEQIEYRNLEQERRIEGNMIDLGSFN